jgi:hypothetical protein
MGEGTRVVRSSNTIKRTCRKDGQTLTVYRKRLMSRVTNTINGQKNEFTHTSARRLD